MEAFSELFTTLIGLLSVFTLGFIIVMGIFLARYFSNRIEEDERKVAKLQREQRGAKA